MHDSTSGFHTVVSGQYSSKFVSGIPRKGYYSGRILTEEPRRIHRHVQTPLICIQSVLSYRWISLRKHPFILALRRSGHFARRNVTFLRAKRPERRRARINGCFRRLQMDPLTSSIKAFIFPLLEPYDKP